MAFGYFTISGSDANNNRIPKICRDSLSRMPRYELQGIDFISFGRKKKRQHGIFVFSLVMYRNKKAQTVFIQEIFWVRTRDIFV